MSEKSTNPRFFNWETKEKCWNKSAIMIGRHPDRWRLDALGNPVCKVNLLVFKRLLGIALLYI